MKLKTIIEESETKSGRTFDFVSQFFIFISLIAFSIETLPDNPKLLSEILDVVEIVTVVLFTIEYLLRLVVSENKLKFIFSFYGVIDLIAIVPFYISLGIDLRALRIVRSFRLFRLFKLLRYNNAIIRLHIAIKSTKEELILFVFATVILLFISSVGIYYFEREAQPDQFCSIFHSLWWSVVTLTTVGYGDMFPVTVGGKLFTSLISFLGVGVVAVPTGLIASALTKTTIVRRDDV